MRKYYITYHYNVHILYITYLYTSIYYVYELMQLDLLLYHFNYINLSLDFKHLVYEFQDIYKNGYSK